MKIFVRTVSIILGLIVAGLAFVFFSPDYDIYFVKSESMKPAVNMGDIVVTGPVAGLLTGNIEPGKIITYQYKNIMVTHRVVSANGETIITMGDAMEEPDPRPVSLDQVKGIVLFKIPYIGYVSSFVRTRLGWWLAVILPAVVLISFLIKDILKEIFRDDKKVQRKWEVALSKKKVATITEQTKSGNSGKGE